MSVDSSLLSLVIKRPEKFVELQRAGIDETFFTDDYAKAWKWLKQTKRELGTIPSKSVFRARFSNVKIHDVRSRDMPILVTEIKKRKKYLDFLAAIDDASRVGGPEDTDEAIYELQRSINELSVRDGNSGMIDLFSEDGKKRILKDQARRRKSDLIGIKTGLNRFDVVTGGLQKGRMVVVMGRPGAGKSWFNLLFVATAVINGHKVGLYPLEMTMEETALRLYSIFSHKLLKPGRALKNLDLMNGRVSKAKIVKLLNLLEDKYAGQLYVADIGSMMDPYTIERVEAEQETYQFDMFWVDYLTLMKAPGVGRDGGEDHRTVKALSNGIKQIAVRHNTVGGASAQVSRQAVSGNILLPRLEHIAYGDSIGQDADHVVPVASRGKHVFYGMVKNRHGPEIGKTRVKFLVNDGVIEDDNHQDADEED